MAAPGNIRELRLKIRSITNLKKITRAMQMVAASKLKKTQARLLEIRAYADRIADLVGGLQGSVEGIEHPLFEERTDVKAAAVVVIAADKGLCGTYNANVLTHTDKFIKGLGKPVKVLPIGRKAVSHFEKRGAQILGRYQQLPTDVPFATLAEIAGIVMEEFKSGRVDEVHVEFTTFVNALTFRSTRRKFIPVERVEPDPEKPKDERLMADYEFEPDPKAILARLLPRYLETSLHRLFLEANSSEHAARMNAMRNATDNASEIIDNLTLIRNKVRQAGITRELLDIVSGAEALKS